MCSASASGDTVINKSTLCVQSDLKYNNNLCGKCPERDHYNALHRVTTVCILFLFYLTVLIACMIRFYYNVCDCHAFIQGNLLTYKATTILVFFPKGLGCSAYHGPRTGQPG